MGVPPCFNTGPRCGFIDNSRIPISGSNFIRIYIDGTVPVTEELRISNATAGLNNVIIQGEDRATDILDLDGHSFSIFYSDTVTVDKVSIVNGLKSQDGEQGGCLFVSGVGAVGVTDSVFENCMIQDTGDDLTEEGGAIAVDNGDLSISNSVFSGNKVPAGSVTNTGLIGRGGAIALLGSSSILSIDNTTFHGNEAVTGSAIFSEGTDTRIDDVRFIENVNPGGSALTLVNAIDVESSDMYFEGNEQIWTGAPGTPLEGGLVFFGTDVGGSIGLLGIHAVNNTVMYAAIQFKGNSTPVLNRCTRLYGNRAVNTDPEFKMSTLLYEDVYDVDISQVSGALIEPLKVEEGLTSWIVASDSDASTDLDCGKDAFLEQESQCVCPPTENDGYDPDGLTECACPDGEELVIWNVVCVGDQVESYESTCAIPDEDDDTDDGLSGFQWALVIAGVVAVVGVGAVMMRGSGGNAVPATSEPDDEEMLSAGNRSTMASIRTNLTSASQVSEVQPRLQRDFDGVISKPKKLNRRG